MNKLDSSTLVLNKGWAAVQVCSVKRAISLLYQGHAKAVDSDYQSYDFEDWSEISQQFVEIDENEFVTSPTFKLKIPRVIVLLFYDKLPKRRVRFSRKNLFERDNFTCQYCQKKPPNRNEALKWMEKNELNLDHVLPRSRGGKTTWENIVVSCLGCNTKKGDKLPEELGWKIKKKPKAPDWYLTANLPTKVVPHKQWVSFLDMAYYNVTLDNDM